MDEEKKLFLKKLFIKINYSSSSTVIKYDAMS